MPETSRAARLFLEVRCPDCDEILEVLALEPGKNPGVQIDCEWDNTKIQIPDVMIKTNPPV